MAKQTILPVVRVAPLGELKVYPITESELDELARGSSSSLFLNFALFFLGIAIPLLFTLRVTAFPTDRTFIVFVVFFVVTLIAGIIFLILWYVSHRSSTRLARAIRDRMPPAPATQQIFDATMGNEGSGSQTP